MKKRKQRRANEKKIEIDLTVSQYSPSGLSSETAKTKLAVCGSNTLTKDKTKWWKVLLRQFLNPLCFLLLAAAIISFCTDALSDGIIIAAIVVLNCVLSFVQEYRSGRAVEKLSTLIKQFVTVKRDNEQCVIDASLLVPGDTVILKNGDVVPAEIKIMEAYNLSVNESQLTGESVPVGKNTSENSLLFAGSTVESGHCIGVVFATGNNTEMGEIAQLSRNAKKKTTYQKSLAKFSFIFLQIIGVTIVLLLSVKAITIKSGTGFVQVLLFVIALAMTSIPEALPMITTITLSSGAMRLAKQKVIVKRLSAVETLGRMNILCTDKTGTLTEDKLTITEIVSDNQNLFNFFACAVINDLHTSFDCAFAAFLHESIKKQTQDYIQTATMPFDPVSKRKRTIIHHAKDNKTYLVVVGAPETLLELSKNYTKEHLKQFEQSGKAGYRSLAIAYKEIQLEENFDILANENNLTYLGFAKMIDPLRKTAKETIDKAREYGVSVKILTGDSIEVAAFVGVKTGLLKHGEKVYSGAELENMSDTELDKVLIKNSVFARVSPQQKYKIIKHLKAKGNVVGYQGDGFNDAPSLKIADVGIAVSSATDVAKSSADIVLLEDNLEVIINGIKNGRSVFANINKYLKHVMIGNLGNFFSLIFFYVVFNAGIPMLAIQLLIGNQIQDMSLFAVFSDRVEADEIKRPQVLGQIMSMMKTFMLLNVFTAIYYLLFFLYIGRTATPQSQAILFLFCNFTQILVVFSIRQNGFFWQGVKPSRLMVGCAVFFIALSVGLVYIPFTAKFMGFSAISAIDMAKILAFTFGYFILLDIFKVIINKISNRKNRIKIK